MLCKIVENNYNRWTWVLTTDDGDRTEISDVQYATRDEALAAAELRFEDDQSVAFLPDGESRGADAPRISLPRVNAKVEAERAGLG